MKTVTISDQIDFNSKTVTRDKIEHNIMIKVSIHQEDVTVIYAPDIRAPNIYKATFDRNEGRNT